MILKTPDRHSIDGIFLGIRGMRNLFFIVFLFYAPMAWAITFCAPGEYLKNDICTKPDTGYYASNCDENYFKINQDFIRLEYIQSTGEQYIDLNHVSPTTNKIKIEFQNAGTESYITNIWGAIDGPTYTTGRVFDLVYFGTAAKAQYSLYVDGVIRSDSADYALKSTFNQDNKIHTMEYNGNLEVWFDNKKGIQSKQLALTHFTPTLNALLFARNTTNGPNLATNGTRIYSFQEKDNNDNWIMNLIPAKRISDKKIGMYDIISNEFYTNTTGNSFIGNSYVVCTAQSECPPGYYCTDGLISGACPHGTYSYAGTNKCTNVTYGYYGKNCNNALPIEYTQLEYLVTDGKSYINTNTKINSNDIWTAKIATDGKPLQSRIMGAMNQNNWTDGKLFNLTWCNNNYYCVYASPIPTPHADYAFWTETINDWTIPAIITWDGNFGATYNNTVMTQQISINNIHFAADYVSYLFASNAADTPSYAQAGVRVYFFNVANKLKMVPAQRNADGTLGMYDLITNTFFTNSGPGKLTPGPIAGCTGQALCEPNYYCQNGVRYNCTNAPNNSIYTDAGWTTPQCPWECEANHALTAANTCNTLCPAGATSLRTDTGINVPLFSSRNTTPSINIKINENICYADLIPGTSTGAINVEYNGQTYHTTIASGAEL